MANNIIVGLATSGRKARAPFSKFMHDARGYVTVDSLPPDIKHMPDPHNMNKTYLQSFITHIIERQKKVEASQVFCFKAKT